MDNAAQLLRKAAILLDSLDGPTAEVLCAQMSSEQAARVRQAVSQLGPVDPGERQRIVDEFLRLGAATAETAVADVELDESLAARIAVAAEVSEDTATDSSTAAPRFAFLQAAPAAALASCLADEHPQTIAVLLAHLPPARAAGVLKLLRAELQAEVVQRLAQLNDADASIVAEVERTLEQSWQTHSRAASSRAAGLATLEAILEASASTDRPVLFGNPRNPGSPVGPEARLRAASRQSADHRGPPHRVGSGGSRRRRRWPIDRRLAFRQSLRCPGCRPRPGGRPTAAVHRADRESRGREKTGGNAGLRRSTCIG